MLEKRRADHRAGELETAAELACERIREPDLDPVLCWGAVSSVRHA